MLTNNQILKIAMMQSAIDSSCEPDDFLAFSNKVVLSRPHTQARKYLTLPFSCDLTSYGNNIVASVSAELAADTESYINKYSVEHCFETPAMQVLNEILKKRDLCVCFMAEYFLPDATQMIPLPCRYKTRLLYPKDFNTLYLPQWSNALCKERRHLDVLGIGAFDGDRLIGLAGCSADCDTMWQIGIDVLPEYRRQGIAACLTSRLALEVLKKDIVPFYCCAWSNIKSKKNALKSGFRPAWVQLTARSIKFTEKMNQ